MKKKKSISYAKWGYIFILPFFIIYFLCSIIPLLSTFYYSFFEYYETGLYVVCPNFVGLENYIKLFTPNNAGDIKILNCTYNTMVMWIMGAVPQIIFAMILALIFTSTRLKIKGQRFFKTVIYMPNLIMASAFAMLMFTLFSNVGPINQIIMEVTGSPEPFQFFRNTWSARTLVAFVNFLMWFGNTTILFMAGIMGIDQSLFEAASIDGATSTQVFFKVTLPLLMPIIVYTLITALIGGLQMFDVPQLLCGGSGDPNGTTCTLVMYLNSFLSGYRNYGMAGALSVILFIITGILSFIVYRSLVTDESKGGKK